MSYNEVPESQTIYHRETNNVKMCKCWEDKQRSKGRGAEEISGDENDTLQLLFCNKNWNEKPNLLNTSQSQMKITIFYSLSPLILDWSHHLYIVCWEYECHTFSLVLLPSPLSLSNLHRQQFCHPHIICTTNAKALNPSQCRQIMNHTEIWNSVTQCWVSVEYHLVWFTLQNNRL